MTKIFISVKKKKKKRYSSVESVSQILPHYWMLWYIKTYLFASLTRRGRYTYNDLTAIFKNRRLNVQKLKFSSVSGPAKHLLLNLNNSVIKTKLVTCLLFISVNSFALLKTSKMLLLSIAFIYTGLELSFFRYDLSNIDIYTTSFPSTCRYCC